MGKIAPPSPRRVGAKHKGGRSTPSLVVMHSTVTATRAGAAASVAHFFATETNPTSAHYVVDEAEVIQCVGDHTVAYHCGYNADSIGIEMCDMPVLGSQAHWWLPKSKRTGSKPVEHGKRVRPLRWIEPQHRRMLKHTANLTARLCLAYGIPIRTLTDAQLRAWDNVGRPARGGGIVTHAQMSRVFKKSSHWDPGKWPSAVFMRRVRKAADRIKADS